MIVELRPALRTETMFENMFGLAGNRKVEPKRNMPKSLLPLAVKAHDYCAQTTSPRIAGTAIRGFSALAAPVGRARGYRSAYPQYSRPAAS